MNYIIILSSILLIVSIIGIIIPSLPSTPVAFLAIMIYAFATNFQIISVTTVIIMAVLTVLSLAISWGFGLLSAKHFGATKYGLIGGLIGVIIGIIFSPFGFFSILICPPLGAIIGEMIGGKQIVESSNSGIGYLIGMLVGIIINMFIIAWMIFVFVKAVF